MHESFLPAAGSARVATAKNTSILTLAFDQRGKKRKKGRRERKSIENNIKINIII